MQKSSSPKRCYLIVLFAVFVLQSGAQCPAVVRKIPFMWISKTESAARKDWFENKKLPTSTSTKQAVLDQVVAPAKHPSSYTYAATDFDALITMINADAQGKTVTGLRIYFAEVNKQNLPDGGFLDPNIILDKQIVLIYSPTDASANDMGNNYFFGTDGKPHPIKQASPGPVAVKQDWVTRYWTNEAEKVLFATVVPTAAENVIAKTGKKSDTKTMLFCFLDFIDFIQTERAYQDSQRQSQSPALAKIDAIEIDFAAYTDAGMAAGPDAGKFKARLHVLFAFKSQGNIVNIDDSNDFNCRMTTVGGGIADTKCSAFKNQLTPGSLRDGDNGQLCPPYNCPPDPPNN